MANRRRPTMADVAARAKVSLSTVSLAYSGAGPISPEMKRRVFKAAEDLGYSGPSAQARALRSGRSHVVGVVIHDSLSLAFRAPLILNVMDGLISDLGEMGLGVLLIPSPRGDQEEKSLLESAPMDAAVLFRVRDHEEPALDILRKRAIPVVVMDAEAPLGGAQVSIDDGTATVELIEHLRGLGHERIGTITLPHAPGGETSLRPHDYDPESAWAPMHNRLRAFKRAGVKPCVVVEARESMVAEGIAAGHLALTHESKPTALVVQSDLLAAGAILAARELDISVPHDVSITGFDGLDLPWLAPHELTTIEQDGIGKGHAMAKMVKEFLEGEVPAPVLTPLTFRVGTTTSHVNPEA
ncbi:substrate-binding domain-containing protein [Demequina sp. B12]|uniref:substrate-binding domain-containing protein n=1 Tax=Demequina sp. B12 TaxID=2992757 RepID=UPI00237C4B89|nr:substrate-binding domain-containing protein [Demequina sp. B12]MDE0572402.1 substrate-binding domain-containing protein [Demequina sp. B12]